VRGSKMGARRCRGCLQDAHGGRAGVLLSGEVAHVGRPRRRVVRRRGGSGVAIFPWLDRVGDRLRGEMWEEVGPGRTVYSVMD
jgi:hypothetical protein